MFHSVISGVRRFFGVENTDKEDHDYDGEEEEEEEQEEKMSVENPSCDSKVKPAVDSGNPSPAKMKLSAADQKLYDNMKRRGLGNIFRTKGKGYVSQFSPNETNRLTVSQQVHRQVGGKPRYLGAGYSIQDCYNILVLFDPIYLKIQELSEQEIMREIQKFRESAKTLVVKKFQPPKIKSTPPRSAQKVPAIRAKPTVAKVGTPSSTSKKKVPRPTLSDSDEALLNKIRKEKMGSLCWESSQYVSERRLLLVFSCMLPATPKKVRSCAT